MTPEQVFAVCRRYASLLDAKGCEAVQDPKAETQEAKLNHVRWMCDETVEFVDLFLEGKGQGHLDKAMRWLGFIQGVLAVSNILTIEEMKADNR